MNIIQDESFYINYQSLLLLVVVREVNAERIVYDIKFPREIIRIKQVTDSNKTTTWFPVGMGSSNAAKHLGKLIEEQRLTCSATV